MGFDEVVVRGAAGHDDVGRDASLVLADPFKDALTLFGRGRSVGFGGAAEDDDGIEVRRRGVVARNGDEVADQKKDVGNAGDEEEEENSPD